MIYVVEEVAHFMLDKLKKGQNDLEGQAKDVEPTPSGDEAHKEVPAAFLTDLSETSFQVSTALVICHRRDFCGNLVLIYRWPFEASLWCWLFPYTPCSRALPWA